MPLDEIGFLNQLNLSGIIAMSATSSTEIQELKDFIKDGFNQLDRKIDDKFNELDRKIDNKFNELDRKIDNVKSELKQEITEVRGDIKGLKGEINTLDARLKNVETAVQKIPEITEKFGELKKRCDPASAKDARERAPRHWRQIAFIIIAAVIGWFAKSGRI